MIANCPTAARAPAGGGRGPAGCLMLYIATAGHSMASNVLGATVIVYVNAYHERFYEYVSYVRLRLVMFSNRIKIESKKPLPFILHLKKQ